MASETGNSGKRPYRKRRRAEHEAETRLRITEAAVDLHGSVGPARTTIKAVAERAGVQRATVYRHFPSEQDLFAACSAHWASQNPPPDPTAWVRVSDPPERLETALAELYEWFEWAEPMLSRTLRDAPLVPAMDAAREGFEAGIAYMGDVLMRGRDLRGRRRDRTRAAIGHALTFATWHSLAIDQGLERTDAVRLMSALVAAAAD